MVSNILPKKKMLSNILSGEDFRVTFHAITKKKIKMLTT